jgi:hypothetical protein
VITHYRAPHHTCGGRQAFSRLRKNQGRRTSGESCRHKCNGFQSVCGGIKPPLRAFPQPHRAVLFATASSFRPCAHIHHRYYTVCHGRTRPNATEFPATWPRFFSRANINSSAVIASILFENTGGTRSGKSGGASGADKVYISNRNLISGVSKKFQVDHCGRPASLASSEQIWAEWHSGNAENGGIYMGLRSAEKLGVCFTPASLHPGHCRAEPGQGARSAGLQQD